MNKAKLDIPLKPDINFLNDRQEKRKKLLKDPEIKQFLKDNNLPETAIDFKIGKLCEHIKNRDICAQCKGVAFCPYHTKGYKSKLIELNDKIDLTYIPCKRYIEDRKANEFIDNYVFYSFSEENFNNSLAKNNKNVTKEMSVEQLKFIATITKWYTTRKTDLYIEGYPGCGKTFWASSISNDLAKEGLSIAFYDMSILAQRIKTIKYDEIASLVNEINSADVLVLDGIGDEAVTVSLRDELLIPSLKYRQNNHKLTIYTSNYSCEELENHFNSNIYGDKDPKKSQLLVSRIRSSCELVSIPTQKED